MKLDHFKNLTEDKQAKYLEGCEALETTLKDNEAEISSLKTENETLKAGTSKLEEDLKKTKELLDMGAITQEEFDNIKKDLLN